MFNYLFRSGKNIQDLLKKSEVRQIRVDKTNMYTNTLIRRGGEVNEEDGAHQANKHTPCLTLL